MDILVPAVALVTAGAVLWSLAALHRKVDRLMAKETDLQATLDQIKTEVTAVAARLQAQADQIKALQDQIAAGTPVSQEQLDALAAEATEIADALAPLAGQ